jgi:alkylated DNA nucleotide flippase Atl1
MDRMEEAAEYPGRPQPPEPPDRPGRSGHSGTPERPGGPATPTGEPEPPQYPEYAERVLDVAELIPPGRVMTYGDIAEWLGEGGPRQVGRVLALYGGAVPWWRVVRAGGTLLPGHEPEALGHYRSENTPLRPAPPGAQDHVPRIDMKRARWDGGGPGGEDPGPGHDENTDGGAHI